jgi:NAD(P)-dependent dehydrogenase (short-subunit alcohol dehydrogenase family)
MSSLQGKIAAVTGAGSGIGRATALRFAREGAIVHLADRHSDPVEAVADEIRATGARATACTVDVTDAEAVQTWADAVFDADGRVDVLYNNAGIGAAGPAESMDAETWRRIIEVNLIGVANGVCAFGPRMLEQSGGGHIVNTASLAGLVAMPGLTAYAASKHGVVGLSESLNAEWEKEGVRVTAICPGIIDTPLTRTVELHGKASSQRDRVVKFYERFGATAEDVANAVVASLGSRVIIRTVPRSHSFPGWHLRRISPRLGQPMARLGRRILRV